MRAAAARLCLCVALAACGERPAVEAPRPATGPAPAASPAAAEAAASSASAEAAASSASAEAAASGGSAEAAASSASASAAAPGAPAADGAGETVTAGPLRVTAVGVRAGDILHVSRLEVRLTGRPDPVQVIDGLQTDTPWPAGLPGLQAPDMNFDGHPDLRLIEFRAAGPNTPWKHWLYDPGRGRFVASEALDALSPTRFDAERRLVVVDWRDRADRAGQDSYAWRQGQLEPVPR